MLLQKFNRTFSECWHTSTNVWNFWYTYNIGLLIGNNCFFTWTNFQHIIWFEASGGTFIYECFDFLTYEMNIQRGANVNQQQYWLTSMRTFQRPYFSSTKINNLSSKVTFIRWTKWVINCKHELTLCASYYKNLNHFERLWRLENIL